MPLRLRDHLHWCECAGRIVFLDVAADRYFGLPGRTNAAFLALAAGEKEARENGEFDVLIGRGLLVESQSLDGVQQPTAIEAPARDFLDDTVPRCGVMPLLRALWWEFRMARQLRSRTLFDVIASAGQRTRNLNVVSGESEIRSIAAAADAIAFVTRSHNRCLVRALGVHGACKARGIRAKLVIGVIAHPFAAHSWVQLGDAVLVGGFEQARLYTPILVLD